MCIHRYHRPCGEWLEISSENIMSLHTYTCRCQSIKYSEGLVVEGHCESVVIDVVVHTVIEWLEADIGYYI